MDARSYKAKNRIIDISAPGKMILCGEHAVAYGYSAISLAINQRMFVKITERDNGAGTTIESKFGILNLNKELYSTKSLLDFPEWGRAIVFLLQTTSHYDLKIEITSNIQNYGFGSSGSLFACVCCGLLLLENSFLTKQELLQKTLEMYFLFCKKSNCFLSGIDIATSIVGGIIFYSSKGKIVENLPEFFFKNYKIFAIWTGYKTNTAQTMMIANRIKDCNRIYAEIDRIVNEVKQILLFEKKDFINCKTEASLSILKKLSENQSLLNYLQLSDENINNILEQCKKHDVFAKISGSGLGDCVIAICENKKKFEIEKYKKIEIKIDPNGIKYDFK